MWYFPCGTITSLVYMEIHSYMSGRGLGPLRHHTVCFYVTLCSSRMGPVKHHDTVWSHSPGKVCLKWGKTVPWNFYCTPFLTGVGVNLWWWSKLLICMVLFPGVAIATFTSLIHALPWKITRLNDVWKLFSKGKFRHLHILWWWACVCVCAIYPWTPSQLLTFAPSFLWLLYTICLLDRSTLTYAPMPTDTYTSMLHKWQIQTSEDSAHFVTIFTMQNEINDQAIPLQKSAESTDELAC